MANSLSLEFLKSKSDAFFFFSFFLSKDFIFQAGRSLMLCVKQEGGLEHHSSPSGVTNHNLELFFCNEQDSLGRSRMKICHWN